jgi:hypothetical protein
MAVVEWFGVEPGNFAPNSVAARESRCTWHGEGRPGDKCLDPPVTGVRVAGGRWLACERAVQEIEERYEVTRPASD